MYPEVAHYVNRNVIKSSSISTNTEQKEGMKQNERTKENGRIQSDEIKRLSK